MWLKPDTQSSYGSYCRSRGCVILEDSISVCRSTLDQNVNLPKFGQRSSLRRRHLQGIDRLDRIGLLSPDNHVRGLPVLLHNRAACYLLGTRAIRSLGNRFVQARSVPACAIYYSSYILQKPSKTLDRSNVSDNQ